MIRSNYNSNYNIIIKINMTCDYKNKSRVSMRAFVFMMALLLSVTVLDFDSSFGVAALKSKKKTRSSSS